MVQAKIIIVAAALGPDKLRKKYSTIENFWLNIYPIPLLWLNGWILDIFFCSLTAINRKIQLNSKFNNHQHPIICLSDCLLVIIQPMTMRRFSPAPATPTRSTSLWRRVPPWWTPLVWSLVGQFIPPLGTFVNHFTSIKKIHII